MTEYRKLLIHECVYCPVVNQLMSVGNCADNCNYYEEEENIYMFCSYPCNPK